jgi:hypothetical protein
MSIRCFPTAWFTVSIFPRSCFITSAGELKCFPRGLKPAISLNRCGTTEVVPFQNRVMKQLLASCLRSSQHNAAVILSEIWRIFAPNEVEGSAVAPCNLFKEPLGRHTSADGEIVFPEASVSLSLDPIPYSLFPTSCSLLPIPCSLFPVPCSLFPTPCPIPPATLPAVSTPECDSSQSIPSPWPAPPCPQAPAAWRPTQSETQLPSASTAHA